MKADKTSLELAIIEAYAHLEDSKPSPTDGGTTFSRFSNGERNWTVPVTLVPLGRFGGGRRAGRRRAVVDRAVVHLAPNELQHLASSSGGDPIELGV